MERRKLTRRVFLGIGAFLVASLFTAFGAAIWFVRSHCKRNHSVKDNPVPDDHFGKVISARFDPPEIYNLDVTTVDSDGAIVTWATAKESTFKITEGTDGAEVLWREDAPAIYHAAELRGLKPDTNYSFLLSEQGANREEHIDFRTLPDPGNVLFRFATFNDNHFKPDGMSWPDGRYFRRCSDIHECLVRDVNQIGVKFIINKGDLTDIYGQYRLRAYKEAVRIVKPPIHTIPGNHDHLRNDDFAADWVDFAGTEQVYRSFDHEGFHFVLLDTSWTGEQERGFLGGKQISWLVDDLEKNVSQHTLIFTHHPVNGDVEENRVIHDYVDFQKAIAQFPNVTAVFSAHVHRNYITRSELTPAVPYVETAAVIQYPNGFNIYEVSKRGIKQTFRKLSDASLSEESWLASPLRCLTNPGDALGKVSDRNFFLEFTHPL